MKRKLEQKDRKPANSISMEILNQSHPLVRAIVRLWKNDAKRNTHELFYEFSDVVLVINGETYHFDQITVSIGKPHVNTKQTSRRMKYFSGQFEVKIHTHSIINQVKNNPNINLESTFELTCAPNEKNKRSVNIFTYAKQDYPNIPTRTWLSILAIIDEALKRGKFKDSDSFKATQLSNFIKTKISE